MNVNFLGKTGQAILLAYLFSRFKEKQIQKNLVNLFTLKNRIMCLGLMAKTLKMGLIKKNLEEYSHLDGSHKFSIKSCHWFGL